MGMRNETATFLFSEHDDLIDAAGDGDGRSARLAAAAGVVKTGVASQQQTCGCGVAVEALAVARYRA